MNNMPFIKINLLPERKKENLQKLIRFIFFKEMLEVMFLVSSFIAMTMLWGWILLQEQYNYLSQSALLVNKEFSKYNQEVRKINFIVKSLNTSNQNWFPLTPKLNELITKLPADIKLSTINLNRESGVFQISGTAKTRDGLLNFQSSLKSYDWLSDFQTPTSQLFEKENISFEFKAKLKNMPAIQPAKARGANNINTGE